MIYFRKEQAVDVTPFNHDRTFPVAGQPGVSQVPSGDYLVKDGVNEFVITTSELAANYYRDVRDDPDVDNNLFASRTRAERFKITLIRLIRGNGLTNAQRAQAYVILRDFLIVLSYGDLEAARVVLNNTPTDATLLTTGRKNFLLNQLDAIIP